MANLNPTLGRSWAKRGWAHGTPTWGQSVPALWRETEVSFERRPKIISDYGSMIGGDTIVIWQTTAHCEIVEFRQQDMSTDFVHGPLLKRTWAIYTAWPDNEDQMPHQGDFVRFTTADGKEVDLQLKHVYIKDSLQDHVECNTIEFE